MHVNAAGQTDSFPVLDHSFIFYEPHACLLNIKQYGGTKN